MGDLPQAKTHRIVRSFTKTALRYHRMACKHFLLCAILVFVTCVPFFTILEASPHINDPDTFYHARISAEMWEHGLRVNFTQLPLTSLRDHFTDHHFIYHVIVAPLTAMMEPIVAVRVAQVFFASLAITAIYALMRWLGFRWAGALSLLIITISQLSFRLYLPKVPALSVALLMLGLYALFARKHLVLLVAGWLYVWLYAGFPILIGITGIGLIVDTLVTMARATSELRRKTLRRQIHANLWLFFAMLSGCLLGIITHPYFPQNIPFFWEQTLRIGLLNQADTIGVGREWFGISAKESFFRLGALGNLLVLPIIFLPESKRLLDNKWITLLILSGFFWLMTLRSQRNIEYLVPLLTVLVGYTLALSLRYPSDLARFLAADARKRIFFYTCIIVVSLVLMSGIIAKDTAQMLALSKQGFQEDYLKKSASFLRDHVPHDELIIHSNWDEFPFLYYTHPDGRYTAGLDPRFLYFADQNTFYTWSALTQGKSEDPAASMDLLGGIYLFVTKKKPTLIRQVQEYVRFEQLYEDEEAIIYRLRAEETDTAGVR